MVESSILAYFKTFRTRPINGIESVQFMIIMAKPFIIIYSIEVFDEMLLVELYLSFA